MAEHEPTMLPARDANAAAQEEYDIALKSGRVEALELFLKRHPDSPLAREALAEIYRLSNQNQRSPR